MSAAADLDYAVQVHWEDTDAAGIVYYANYLKFMERGRSDMVRRAGIDQVALLRHPGILFAVRKLAIDYLKPAHLGDRLTVTTQLHNMRGARLQLGQSVLRGKEILTVADVGLACIARSGKPFRIPSEIHTALFTFTNDRKNL